MPTLPSRPHSALVTVCLAVPLVLPLLAVVVLSAPAWLTWPFLPAERQRTVLRVLDRLVHWTRAAVPDQGAAAGRAPVEER